MAQHSTQRPQQAYPGDRTSTTSLYSLEARLHLELIRTGPTPTLLREVALVNARLNGGER
jgi:hypothetical protein